MDKILFYFRKKDYGWLSNFERAAQRIDRVSYPTNEHYYQAQKAADPRIRGWILMAPNPHCAMIAGRGLRPKEMVKDWKSRKVKIMYTGLLAKFTQNQELRNKLLLTGKATLHEDSPTDMFWGVKGDDMLGHLLMKVRDVISNYDYCPGCGLPSVNFEDDEPMCDSCGWAA